MKKIIISLTLLSFFNFYGCFTSADIPKAATPDNYIKYEQEEGKPSEIYVVTKDILTYHFEDSGYNIVNDTLFGEGAEVVDAVGTEIPFKGNIPIQNIANIQWTETDVAGLILRWFCVTVLLLVLIGYAFG